jgi:hypothetical protein
VGNAVLFVTTTCKRLAERRRVKPAHLQNACRLACAA